jgi:hypothetical protein
MVSRALEIKGKAIRKELAREYKLTRQQATALPTMEQLLQVAHSHTAILLPMLFESLMNPADRAWMENGPQGETLDESLGELTPSRKVELTREDRNTWDTLSNLSRPLIDILWAQGISNFDEEKSPAERQKAAQEREERGLRSYREFLVTLVEGRNKTPKELGPFEGLIRMSFPLPPDPPKREGNPHRPRKPRRPKTSPPDSTL